jgi:hypothetical protein
VDGIFAIGDKVDNLATWWLVRRMAVPDALDLLTRLGYDGYEMFDWRDPKVLDSFLAQRDKSIEVRMSDSQ